jgi:biopolymer transport protein ExbB
MELIIITLLILTSLIGLTFIVERGVALRWRKVLPRTVESAVEGCRSAGDVPMLKRLCEENPSALGRLLLSAIEHLEWTREENIAIIETRARHEINRLENGIVILEIVVGVAPLLGLVGTIFGLIRLFSNMGPTGMSDNPSLFSREIGTALYATFLGLITAIPSLIAWNYYNRKIEALGVEMERLCDEFLRRLYRHEKSGGNGASAVAASPVAAVVAQAPATAAPVVVRVGMPPSPAPTPAPAPEPALPPVMAEATDEPAFAPVFEAAPSSAASGHDSETGHSPETSHPGAEAPDGAQAFGPGGANRGSGQRPHGKGSKKGRHG